MTDDSQSRTLKRLAAIEDIRRLKAEYCLQCDRGYAPDAFGELFAEDATWQSAGRGRFEGRAAIVAFFATASSAYPWAAHLVTNPIVDVGDDMESATGIWRMIMPASAAEADGSVAAVLQISEYHETYRLESGRWLIASLDVTHRRLTFERGQWVER
jgi:hypothetical protein